MDENAGEIYRLTRRSFLEVTGIGFTCSYLGDSERYEQMEHQKDGNYNRTSWMKTEAKGRTIEDALNGAYM